MSIHGVRVDTEKSSYVLRYDFNSLCAAEARAGRELALMGDQNIGLPTLARLFIAGSMSTARVLLWAGLLHSAPDMTVEDSGEIMQEYLKAGGTIGGLTKKIDEAMNMAGFETTAGLMSKLLNEEDEAARQEAAEELENEGN